MLLQYKCATQQKMPNITKVGYKMFQNPFEVNSLKSKGNIFFIR